MIDLDYELVLKNPHLWDNKTLDWAREKEQFMRDCGLAQVCVLCGFSLGKHVVPADPNDHRLGTTGLLCPPMVVQPTETERGQP